MGRKKGALRFPPVALGALSVSCGELLQLVLRVTSWPVASGLCLLSPATSFNVLGCLCFLSVEGLGFAVGFVFAVAFL